MSVVKALAGTGWPNNSNYHALMHNTAHGDDCNFMGGSSILLYGVNGEPIDNWFSVVVTGESF